jgi:hypothetical protein
MIDRFISAISEEGRAETEAIATAATKIEDNICNI